MHSYSNNKHQLSHQAWYILLDVSCNSFKGVSILKNGRFLLPSRYMKFACFFYSIGRLCDNIRLLSKCVRKMNELFNIVQEPRMQTIHPSILIYQSIYSSIYALIYSSIDLSDHPYYLSIHFSIHSSMHSSIYFIYIFILSIYIFISTSTHPSVHLTIHSFIQFA